MNPNPSLLLVSHQLDYSGAPLALLSMARALQSMGRTVHLHTLRDGPLRKDFEALGISINTPVERKGLRAVVANTVNALEPCLHSTGPDIPVIGWIHEPLEVLPMLNLRPEKLKLNTLAAAVFPSELQASQFAPYLGSTRTVTLPNVVEQPYRAAAHEWRYDYCLSGSWDRRNDQRVLLRYLSELRRGARIALIGANLPQDYKFDGLELTLFGVVSPAQAKQIIAESRMLISHSMAETQNLAAIEALMAGRPGVLSDIPAHRRLAALTPLAVLFERDRPEALQKALQRAERLAANQLLIDAGRKVLDDVFGWDEHLRNIRNMVPHKAAS